MEIITADLERDRTTIIDSRRRFLMRDFGATHYDWLYKGNPFGPAKCWFAIDNRLQRVIGTAAAFPRAFYMGEDEVGGWVFGDFCFDSDFRSLGPALQLQRVCLDFGDLPSKAFCYDFPSSSMVAVYKRLGVSIMGRMLRLAKLLRVDRKARGLVSSPIIHRAVSLIGNTLLKPLPITGLYDAVDVSIHVDRCGEEFSVLDCAQRGRLGICAKRSAHYLNWRYVDNPFVRHEILTARKDGVLKGYAIWKQMGDDAFLVDLMGESDSAVVKALIGEAIRILRTRKVMTLSVCVNDGHPWLAWYREIGFHPRDSAPMVFVPSPSLEAEVDLRTAKLFLTEGDRDS